MSLESSDKEQAGRSVPLTATQQAAEAKSTATAEKVRNVAAKMAGGSQKASKSAAAKDTASKVSESKVAAAKSSESKAAAAAEPEPVEDKAAAKARKKQEKAEAKARAKAEKAERKEAAKAEQRRVASGGIKDVFVLHVEKIVLGVSVLVALGLIYAAIGPWALSLTPNHYPSDMNKRLDGIDARIKNTSFDPVKDLFTLPVYGGSVDRFKSTIRPSSLVLPAPWEPPIVPKQKRGGPPLYPPRQLLATAGNGVFLVKQLRKRPERNAAAGAPAAAAAAVPAPAAAAPAGGGDAALLIGDAAPGAAAPAAIPDGQPVPIPNDLLPKLGVRPPPGDGEQRIYPEGRRWISITGLLPVFQQQAGYDKEFANAFDHDPYRDQPLYAEIRFQRLEVPPGTAENQLDWSKAKVWTWEDQLAMNKAEQSVWVLTAPEVAPQKFIRNDAGRLPENLRAAGLGLISKPLGPLVYQPWDPWATHPGLYEAPVVEEVAPEAKEEEAAEEPAEVAPVAPPPMDDPFGLKKPVPAPAAKKKAAAKKAGPKARNNEPKEIEFQLVRVFDFTVEPGKQYRYKLQLMLRNPNHQIAARNLQDPELAVKAWLSTDWSEASNTVAVPDGQSVLAGSITKPEAPAADAPRVPAGQAAAALEATARVVVKILNFDAAQETFAELTLRRGALVAGVAQQLILNPLRGEVAQKRAANIRTDVVLADFRGGEKLADGLESPAEMLFIDAAGQLVVQNSVRDETWVSTFHRLADLFTRAAPAADGMGTADGPMAKEEDANLLRNNARGGPRGRDR